MQLRDDEGRVCVAQGVVWHKGKYDDLKHMNIMTLITWSTFKVLGSFEWFGYLNDLTRAIIDCFGVHDRFNVKVPRILVQLA